jgi:hypothetical protein
LAITKGTWVATSGNLTTGFTLVVPAAVVANDIVVIGITNRDATGNPTCVDNEGAGTWARITTVSASTNGSISIWWKKATASTNGKTVTVGSCTGSASGALGYYRGAAALSSSPFGTAVPEANASADVSQAGVTTGRDGSAVIHLVGCTSNDTLNPGNRSATSPTTITEDAEGVSAGGSDCSLSFASDVKTTAGATGTISWTQAGGNGTGASLAIELLAAIGTLTAASGSFAITGTDATLKYNRQFVADSGAYAVTGTDATLRRSFPLIATSGTFAITGADATLRYGRSLTAASGSYVITGADATLKDNRKIVADSGSFAWTGTDAALTYNQASGYTLSASGGALAITGTDAGVKLNRLVTATAGSFAWTGTGTTLEINRIVAASAGAFSIVGTDATLTHGAGGLTLTCDAGVFTITGIDAELTHAVPPTPRPRKHARTFATMQRTRSFAGVRRLRRVR